MRRGDARQVAFVSGWALAGLPVVESLAFFRQGPTADTGSGCRRPPPARQALPSGPDDPECPRRPSSRPARNRTGRAFLRACVEWRRPPASGRSEASNPGAHRGRSPAPSPGASVPNAPAISSRPAALFVGVRRSPEETTSTSRVVDGGLQTHRMSRPIAETQLDPGAAAAQHADAGTGWQADARQYCRSVMIFAMALSRCLLRCRLVTFTSRFQATLSVLRRK